MAFPAVEKKATEQALGRPNKAPVVFLFSGESGEQYGYADEVETHGVYSYAGEGQVSDMTITRGNLAAQEQAATGQALHLFRLGD